MRTLTEGERFQVRDEITEALTGEVRTAITVVEEEEDGDTYFIVQAEDSEFYEVVWDDGEGGWVGVIDDSEGESLF